MAFGPMAHGLLTGAMTPETTFGEDDFRSRGTVFEQPLFEGEHFLKYLRRVDALKEAARDRGFTVAQLALAWVIANPIVSVALAGTRRPEEIEENVRAVEWRMTAERASRNRGHRGCHLDRAGGAPGPCLAGERLEVLQSRMKHS